MVETINYDLMMLFVEFHKDKSIKARRVEGLKKPRTVVNCSKELRAAVDVEVLEGVLDVVGDITDLLDPSLDHLVLVTLFICGHQESQHHIELVLDEGLVALYAELQGDLFGERGFGVAKCSAQHGLAHAQRRRFHGRRISHSSLSQMELEKLLMLSVELLIYKPTTRGFKKRGQLQHQTT
ncbi:hypothetical protein U9M48_038002 [Paspalum notatum var. saurae]|uniref:Uncharacterized protein n=1 Tax=Paspalum notatum var. saurae TaxID=547442 RepID=A0AAQ3UG63_PASNO